MKKAFSWLGITLTGALLAVNLLSAPIAHASQGYAVWDFTTSKESVAVGEEFTVSAYITGRDNAEYGDAVLSMEAWIASDTNPKGYEFVSFQAGSDFPIDAGHTISTGTYGYQCREFHQKAAADMTGRHLFGRFTYRAINKGSYAFGPSLPCRLQVDSLSGAWSFILDYSNSYVTISQPTPPAGQQTNTPPPSNSTKPSASNPTNAPVNTPTTDTSAAQSAANSDTAPKVKSSHTTRNPEQKPTKAVVKSGKNYWWLLALLAVPALFTYRKLPYFKKRS